MRLSTTFASLLSFCALSVSAQFVTTSGTDFQLDGEKFTVFGSNSYWVGLGGYSAEDVATAFDDIKGSGATTVRTWGFNEVTSPSGIYYQSWSDGVPTVNTGSDGLEHFDSIVAAAEAAGLKLIVALTNNWKDYGGMDIYVSQLLGSTDHSLFYTDETVKDAFKSYINTFVFRYADSSTIMAWELSNEPRCPGCDVSVLTSWAEEISAYIKSIDPNHLVALGDEGFFNDPTSADYPYQGGEGVDFEANLAIDTIDFGTFHAYPEGWGAIAAADPTVWGSQWIEDHAAVQDSIGKPVIIEEYGVANADQVTVYGAWLGTVLSSGLAGDLIWQAGSHLPGGDTHNDGYAVYPDGEVYALLQEHGEALSAA